MNNPLQDNEQNVSTMGIGAPPIHYAPPTLLERIQKRKAVAVEAKNRVAVLTELELLFEKHPDIARILELLEVAGL